MMVEIDCVGLVLVAEADDRRSAAGSRRRPRSRPGTAPPPAARQGQQRRRRQRGARNESGTMRKIRAPFASRRRQDRRPSPTTAHDMRPNDSLAVVIVAKNEAARIADCIASAAFADEVLVLDSGSTDRTAAIARAAGARVVVTDWPGYGPQVARGFSLAQSDWVLSLDADERIPPKLQAEIRAAIAGRRARRLPHPALVGVLRQGDAPRRLATRPHACGSAGARSRDSRDDFLHAHMTVDGSVGDLDESLIHHSYPDVHDVLEKLDRYSSGSARDMHSRGADREPGEGDRARPVRFRAHVSAEARIPRWSARIDACDLQRGVCLLQIREAHVHAESADSARSSLHDVAGERRCAGPGRSGRGDDRVPACGNAHARGRLRRGSGRPSEEPPSLASEVAAAPPRRAAAPDRAVLRRHAGAASSSPSSARSSPRRPSRRFPALLKVMLDDGMKQSASRSGWCRSRSSA